MMRRFSYFVRLVIFAAVLLPASLASAQYAVGHRTFGVGTALGVGYSRMDLQFPEFDANRLSYLFPTLELKAFLGDTLSIDVSVPVINIATSNALHDYFSVVGEAYLNFHPSAPASFELFAAPGFGVSYAYWKGKDGQDDENAYAFHIPVRLGMEFNNQRRNMSVFVALRPFFSIVHGGLGDTNPGGGGLVELGFMAYTTRYRADRY